ncbi:acyl carrier protein [Streptomyces prunicolor]|uniref:Acyl carrier protein n=1 Tax=Streptomyces prunicolor TaxID=67348 RepID=A0ABU4FPA1_9ACTN|nr:acyl carrier protein [Streptomyces prunicolor]MDV7222439.1 acyl carrier protein [Streptomyces prunicolor]
MDLSTPLDPGGTETATEPALSRAELSLTVRTAVSDVLGTEVDDIDEATDLGNDFGIDSLELMDVGSRLEHALRVKIPVSDLLEARTVGDAVDLLARRMGRAA